MNARFKEFVMEILGVLWERRSPIPIAHTRDPRTIQKAVQWLQVFGYVEYIGEDLWTITEKGTEFFNKEVGRTA